MKVAEYIVDVLHAKGVDVVFGYIGGFNADIVDYIGLKNKQHFVLNYHEQASAFAANAFSLVKENLAVAMASGAPSSVNLIPGIANAYFDSIPCVFIVGSVHSKAVRTSNVIRQNAFEEINIVSLISDITKFSAKIANPLDIKYYLQKALHIAQEGRKGPVLLDIPYDVARSDINADELKEFTPSENDYDDININEVVNIIKGSKKPLFLLGGGARSKESKQLLDKLLHKIRIPAVASLCGLDAISHDNECFAGFIGHYGNRYANFALANCDCLIILGSRLDERQLAGDKSKFAPSAKVIRVDIDRFELNRILREDISVYSSVELFLKELSECSFDNSDFSRWLHVIAVWKERYPSHDLKTTDVNANNFLYTISRHLPDDAVICSDVGQNQMSVAQSMRLDKNRKLLNCGGYGSMGFSLPAAIGAAYARKGTVILSVNGDGGFQMNMQELQTIKRDNLPVNIVILNNRCLGMIRRLQERIFDNRTYVSIAGYSAPDYSAIAYAYDIKYLRVDSVDKYELAKDLISNKRPSMIELILPQEMENNPEPGVSIDMQTPLLTDDENDLVRGESSWQ